MSDDYTTATRDASVYVNGPNGEPVLATEWEARRRGERGGAGRVRALHARVACAGPREPFRPHYRANQAERAAPMSSLDAARALELDVSALYAIAAERDDLERADAANRERVAAVMEPYEAAVVEWRRASDAAVLRGEAPPPEPERPNLN